jgi:CheY-like chemotaxis protein
MRSRRETLGLSDEVLNNLRISELDFRFGDVNVTVFGLLKDRGLEVIECTTGEATELVLAAAGPELLALVTDVNLDGRMTGAELAEFAKEKFPLLTVVVMSGKPPPRLPKNARFLAKPYSPTELLDAIF